MGETRWLDEREERAWRGYLRMRALLDLQISRDLGEDSNLSDTDYHVLAALSEASRRLRLLDLAERMLWSQSRLAHHLARIEKRSLVARERHPTNSRATIVVLTDHGQATLASAAPPHLASVRRHFIDRLTPEQLEVLGELTDVVVEHLRAVRGPDPGGAADDVRPEQPA